jgi:hypothetical protein
MIDSFIRVGFITTKQKGLPLFLASHFNIHQSKNLVARGGIEPPTQGFSILCSTD